MNANMAGNKKTKSILQRIHVSTVDTSDPYSTSPKIHISPRKPMVETLNDSFWSCPAILQ